MASRMLTTIGIAASSAEIKACEVWTMIVLSRLRRGTTKGSMLALLLLSSLALESCGLPHSCTEIGCAHGLDIVFDGPPLAAGTRLQIQIDIVGQLPEPSPIIYCELSSSGGGNGGPEQLLCNSYLRISESGTRTLKTGDVLLPMVMVTISSDGTELSQQTFTPVYTRTEPNGPDCGPVCMSSTIHVALPQPAQL
jgi:hypothetical protein